jgi:hypothetical protein
VTTVDFIIAAELSLKVRGKGHFLFALKRREDKIWDVKSEVSSPEIKYVKFNQITVYKKRQKNLFVQLCTT